VAPRAALGRLATLATLATHRALERLDLEGGGITSAGVAHLATLPRLRDLTIRGPGVDEAVIDVVAGFPALRAFQGPLELVGGLERLPARVNTRGGLGGCERCDPRNRDP